MDMEFLEIEEDEIEESRAYTKEEVISSYGVGAKSTLLCYNIVELEVILCQKEIM